MGIILAVLAEVENYFTRSFLHAALVERPELDPEAVSLLSEVECADWASELRDYPSNLERRVRRLTERM